MRKIFFFIALLGFIHIPMFSQQIDFFNVGVQDKPLPNIIISMEKKPEGYFVKNIVVFPKVYELIKQYAIDNSTQNKPLYGLYERNINSCAGDYDFGCYAVQMSGESDSLLYFMDTNEKSVKYFKSLAAFLDKKGYLGIAEFFQGIIVRISLVDNELAVNEAEWLGDSADRHGAETDQFPKKTAIQQKELPTSSLDYVMPVDNTRVVIPYKLPDYER